MALREPAEFDQMFIANEDPWGFRNRWYELRKRQIALASLPRQRYRRAYEPGCANGELSACLAQRCDTLVVSDGAPSAVRLTRSRVQNLRNVDVRELWVPDQWPEGLFDLIVISELGYFLDRRGLEHLCARILASLDCEGTVLACHWLHGCDPLGGHQVDEVMRQTLGLALWVEHLEDDFRLSIWTRRPGSVARDEGLVELQQEHGKV